MQTFYKNTSPIIPLNISEQTLAKAQYAKQYIQKKYSLNKVKEQQQRQNWKKFQKKIQQLNLTLTQKKSLKNHIVHEQMNQFRKQRSKITRDNFQSIHVIGRGAFGQVRLCRQIKTNRIVAIKCLKKKEMIKKNQQIHVRQQRNILTNDSDWIVKLIYSFQDSLYLYLVMQFLQGGDLMTLLISRNILPQNQAKFYIVELIAAVQAVHALGYIHRDIKPDNILISNDGHIKLSDFGLCKKSQIETKKNQKQQLSVGKSIKPEHNLKKLQKIRSNSQIDKRRRLAYSAVGTPDYIAPQMLRKQGYSQSVDYWSIGIMLYEMLVGYAPFTSDRNQQIYYKIQHHQEYLQFPQQIELSNQVIDLIRRLLVNQKKRLNMEQIKSHRWFKQVDWNNIRKLVPPFIPKFSNQVDISYFDKYQQQQPWITLNQNLNQGKDFNFIGYTFKEDQERDIFGQTMVKIVNEKQKQQDKQRQIESLFNANMKKIKTLPNQQPQRLSKRQKNNNLCTTTILQKTKTKSPFNQKDMNDKIPKKTNSKSPIPSQKSTSTLKKITATNFTNIQQIITTIKSSSKFKK